MDYHTFITIGPFCSLVQAKFIKQNHRVNWSLIASLSLYFPRIKRNLFPRQYWLFPLVLPRVVLPSSFLAKFEAYPTTATQLFPLLISFPITPEGKLFWFKSFNSSCEHLVVCRHVWLLRWKVLQAGSSLSMTLIVFFCANYCAAVA